jgi:DNA-binding CsgD family transcriptional regulator
MAGRQPDQPLTPKERQALDLYQRGMSHRSIAIHLGVSRTTVRDRIANANTKLADAGLTVWRRE